MPCVEFKSLLVPRGRGVGLSAEEPAIEARMSMDGGKGSLKGEGDTCSGLRVEEEDNKYG